jgi:phosphoserine phosphatase
MTSDETSPAKHGAARPQLTTAMRSSSYLREHQQYRPPNQPGNHYGIDTVVEDLSATRITPPNNIPPFNGIPSADNPPKIVEGPFHDLSHQNCAPPPGVKPEERLIATLFYKASSPRVSNNVPSPRKIPSPTNLLGGGSGEESEIPANMAPVTNLETFPLEPPAAEPEPLDHLYGSYVSPMCIAAFLDLMSQFPLPRGADEMFSAHRCLDSVEHPLVVELTLSPAPAPGYLPLADLRKHENIYRFEREWNVDVVLQPDTLWRRYPRLVAFDMDSTLIKQEVIDLLGAAVPGKPEIGARIADITARAMAGELGFEEAFRERLGLLKGLGSEVFEGLKKQLEVTRGVPALLRALKRLGVKTAVLSGGFFPLTFWLAVEQGVDYAHANKVLFDDAGKLTGEIDGPIVGRERKRDLLLEIAAGEKIPLEQAVVVGDGANDLLMMEAAGLGVAWNAKPMVQMEANARLNGDSLLDLLYLFGFTKVEIEQLSA